MSLNILNRVQFLSEGTVWGQLARSSSVQPAEIWPVWDLVSHQAGLDQSLTSSMQFISVAALAAAWGSPAGFFCGWDRALPLPPGPRLWCHWNNTTQHMWNVFKPYFQASTVLLFFSTGCREHEHVCMYLRNSRSSQPLCRSPCSYLSSPSLCSHSPTEDSPTDRDELLLPQSA